MDLPRADKKFLVIAETDGCAVDGIIAAIDCHVGGRTLRILDFGKVAATFVDTYTEEAIRIAPNGKARTLLSDYAPNARNHWQDMLLAYQVMPVEELFCVQYVHLNLSLAEIVSKLSKKAQCEICDEEIAIGREATKDGSILCRSCAGEDYHRVLDVSKSFLMDENGHHMYGVRSDIEGMRKNCNFWAGSRSYHDLFHPCKFLNRTQIGMENSRPRLAEK